jgi:hypothetical protein
MAQNGLSASVQGVKNGSAPKTTSEAFSASAPMPAHLPHPGLTPVDADSFNATARRLQATCLNRGWRSIVHSMY